jgi:ATP-dependent Clp protease protease subunit
MTLGQPVGVVPPGPAYVTFSCPVNQATTQNLLNIVHNSVAQKITEFHLLISSNGGDIMQGVNLYNVLRAMPFHLTTHNVGNVDSIANAIYLAGDERHACPSATFMFHGVAFNGTGMNIDITIAKERLKALQSDENRLVGIVADRSGMSAQKVRRLYKGMRTMTATEAQSNGLVDSIAELVVPPNAQVANIPG